MFGTTQGMMATQGTMTVQITQPTQPVFDKAEDLEGRPLGEIFSAYSQSYQVSIQQQIMLNVQQVHLQQVTNENSLLIAEKTVFAQQVVQLNSQATLFAELKTANEELKAENAELKRDNIQLKADNVQLKEDNAELKKDSAELKVVTKNLERDVSDLSTKLNDLADRYCVEWKRSQYFEECLRKILPNTTATD